MAWVALWRALHQTRKYSFLMISPKLLDFSPFFFLISSPLGTADFLMLLELSGDAILCCVSKNSLRDTLRLLYVRYLLITVKIKFQENNLQTRQGYHSSLQHILAAKFFCGTIKTPGFLACLLIYIKSMEAFLQG